MDDSFPFLGYTAFALGLLLYVLVMFDVFITTISMHGSGPITGLILKGAHRLLSAPPSKLDGDRPRPVAALFAKYSNLALTLSLFFTWFSLLLLGLTLMLFLQADAVLTSDGEGQATLWQRLYFAGASITTAGFGDYVPGRTTWQYYTVLMATSGLIVSSLGVSYVINIVGASLQQRACARFIHGHGGTVESMLAASWDGERFSGLDSALTTIAQQLTQHTQNHLAYPMVHYVRTNKVRDSMPTNVALMDEVLSVLLLEVPQEHRPATASLIVARRAVTAYLESMNAIYVDGDAENDPPPWPDLSFVHRDWEFETTGGYARLRGEELEALRDRRHLLKSAIESQGLTWDDTVLARSDRDVRLDVDLARHALRISEAGRRSLSEDRRASREHEEHEGAS